MSTTLASRYDPKEAQDRWYAFWEKCGYFYAKSPAGVPSLGGEVRPGEAGTPTQPFTIVIPPPNVTGALHMGHALNNTLQDILIRWRRMQGFNTLWVPGTDHAGIATQAVVEKRIREQEGKTRRELGRDELVRRIWEWKDEYERRILSQLRRLGCSCDWRRTRFTLDHGCSRAVRETFFKMFRDGLIYRGKRLVNWDTQLQTSVADDETYTEDVKSGFWTFKYPVKEGGERRAEGGEPEYIRFSTTRPETMLGDTAVAVHPNDERYKHLIGKTVIVPLVGREIPIIADGNLADPTLGTGAVKVTPAHDPNDYACWQRHLGKPDEIGMINILNPDGTINESGGKYAGIDRYNARDFVTADMDALGLFEGREDRFIPLKFSDRSKSPIEPYLSDQWFVRMSGEPRVERREPEPAAASDSAAVSRLATRDSRLSFGLAEMAMAAVRDGRVKIHPERYAKTYLDWLGEKRDWCISRQLWWGHRIPVWTGPEYKNTGLQYAAFDWESQGRVAITIGDDGRSYVCVRDADDAEVVRLLEAHQFEQDPDVLDTWFSSQLWPHSTLGWPERTRDLEYYYPTSVLVTSRDIITLWVARMVIAGLYNCGEVPFHDVYITPKILDGFGQTMSKMRGNGVNPLDIIDKYGADALRFEIARMTTDLQDARLPVGYECPFCETYITQKIEHQQMKPKDGKNPRIKCPSCKKDFQFSSPNFDPDPGEPAARMVSERFELGRNFANKLWNAARFVLMNLEDEATGCVQRTDPATPVPAGALHAPHALADEDRWILSRLADTIERTTEHLENFRFSDTAKTLYDFAWSEFCDWYVEMTKLRLRDPATRPTAQRVLAFVLDQLLRLLHPIMPFVTEHIWQALSDVAPERGLSARHPAAPSVMIAPWPVVEPGWRDDEIEKSMDRLQGVIRAIRNIRSNFNVDLKSRVAVHIRCSTPVASELAAARPFIEQLASVDSINAGPDVTKPADSVSAVAADWELYVPLTGLIDVTAEIERQRKLLATVCAQHKSNLSKLSNADFVAQAPPEVVEQHRRRAEELLAQKASIEEILRELGGSA